MHVERATVTAIETAPWARNWLNCWPLYLLPHHALSRLMLVATRLRFRPWKDWQIRWFIRRYGVDMDSVAESDARVYPEFNSFFTRALRADARPIAPDPCSLACPVDGSVSQLGDLRDGLLIQAKGQHYSVSGLLASREAEAFLGGHFITLYLAPKDYHRVHMPVTGRLLRSVHV
ncbi:MAG: phosphatidylserine decarboxylase, partial [Burkholderiales bacterium]